MGYSLHIERPPIRPNDGGAPIPLDEWKAAVAKVSEVQLSPSEPHIITNPANGDQLMMKQREGDADVYFPKDGEWIWVFSWHESGPSFRAPRNANDRTDPVWAAAVQLAKELGAEIRGDEGERYDLETGKVVK